MMRRHVRAALIRTLQGAIIGVGAILPGVSGSVLCVSFGIYRPIMELLSHPRLTLRKHIRMLLPVAVGWVIGFLAFAKVASAFFAAQSVLAIWLILGLIAGTFPTLYRESGKQGRSKKAILTFIICFLVTAAGYLALRRANAVTSIVLNPAWALFCGVLWGLSVLIPGMTSSTILIFLGLFEPLVTATAAFHADVLLPVAVGTVGSVVLLSRGVDSLFARHYAVAYHCVLGVMLASTLAIVPVHFVGAGQVLGSAALFVVGFAFAWISEKMIADG
ncbi:MAG: DUF368 domain-containing protein [Oscillospiraceae bacterium]|nr:DUF368 domain-containing protein [Oscillospiraceae bacterium]